MHTKTKQFLKDGYLFNLWDIPYCIKFSRELIFAVFAILLKSAKISSREIFQNRPSAKISSREILTQNGTTTNMMEMYLICFKKIHNKLIHVF